MAALYFGVNFSAIATSSAAKTIVGVKCPANQTVRLLGFCLGFDGVDSSKGPALVEIGTCTWASNAPGTNSTGPLTLVSRDSGRPETIQSSAGSTWTVEPTVISVVETFLVPTYMGAAMLWYPLNAPIVGKGGNGFVMRVTLPAAVTANASGSLQCEE